MLVGLEGDYTTSFVCCINVVLIETQIGAVPFKHTHRRPPPPCGMEPPPSKATVCRPTPVALRDKVTGATWKGSHLDFIMARSG